MIIAYRILQTIIPLILLFYINPVHAGLFSATQTSITLDVVWVYSNSSTLAHTDNNFTPIFFNRNIEPAANLSQPVDTGLKGILYYQETKSCIAANTNNGNKNTTLNQLLELPLPSTLPRIALIKQEHQPECTHINSILKAQSDGAVGVIMYGSQIDPSRDDDNIKIPTGTNISITVYFVGPRTGEELYEKIELYKSMPSSSLGQTMSVRPFVRVLMLPAVSGGINAWEVTLLVVSILLVTSFLASVVMHWHIWRKRRRQEYLIAQGLIPTPVEMLPMGKHILQQTQLETLFPAKEVTETPSDEAAACVICLEPMSIGSKVRKLPCEHEYHCHCIDPWLTSKCAECPLCKYDCSQVPKASTEGQTSDIEAATTNERPSLWRRLFFIH